MYPIVITIPNPAAAIALLPAGARDFQIAGFLLQPDDGASGPMFIGGADVAVTTPYWFRIAAPAGGVPPVPLILTHPTGIGQASQLYVIGTAGDILRGFLIRR